ncbi:MAG: hypothetical protein COV45_03895 [Deltaproteobacteria bacterium CG11_big_fil_rev_8_21_14_0_20_47_16]|nr:MAG: hypothetical protein COV45_03895 [Deltaproteobacteria bacterium CG11_big_fil_rev_8_21_14_0_20_47_16]
MTPIPAKIITTKRHFWSRFPITFIIGNNLKKLPIIGLFLNLPLPYGRGKFHNTERGWGALLLGEPTCETA